MWLLMLTKISGHWLWDRNNRHAFVKTILKCTYNVRNEPSRLGFIPRCMTHRYPDAWFPPRVRTPASSHSFCLLCMLRDVLNFVPSTCERNTRLLDIRAIISYQRDLLGDLIFVRHLHGDAAYAIPQQRGALVFSQNASIQLDF